MVKKIVSFFDKLEDKIRIGLSHTPILYSLIGAVGVVLVWKGVWETAEYFPILFGPVSVILGVLILLVTGLFVSFFIGDSIIISGFKREKKIAERTEAEVVADKNISEVISAKLDNIEKEIQELKSEN